VNLPPGLADNWVGRLDIPEGYRREKGRCAAIVRLLRGGTLEGSSRRDPQNRGVLWRVRGNRKGHGPSKLLTPRARSDS